MKSLFRFSIRNLLLLTGLLAVPLGLMAYPFHYQIPIGYVSYLEPGTPINIVNESKSPIVSDVFIKSVEQQFPITRIEIPLNLFQKYRLRQFKPEELYVLPSEAETDK